MTTPSSNPRPGKPPESVTGVQLMQGVGVAEARGFWADAWSQVIRRPGAVGGLIWVSIVAFFAIWSPLLASGHPLVAWPAAGGSFWSVHERGVEAVLAKGDTWTLLVFVGLWSVAWVTAPSRLNGTFRVVLGLLALTPFALRIFAAFFAGVSNDDAVHAAVRPVTDYVRGLTPGPFPYQLIVDSGVVVGLIWLAGVAGIPRLTRLWTVLVIPAIAAVAISFKALASQGATFPLYENLSAIDKVLLILGAVVIPWVMLGGTARAAGRAGAMLVALIVAILVVSLGGIAEQVVLDRDAADWLRAWRARPHAGFEVAACVAGPVALVAGLIPWAPWRRRAVIVGSAAAIAAICVGLAWNRPLERFNYHNAERAEQIRAVYTAVEWSPRQRFSELTRKAPMSTLGEGLNLPVNAPGEGRLFILGTDAFGSDVLTQMMHACRLSISIGLVSTGIALLIGVTLGALMGYFGGWVDLALYRVVEVFMAVPVLFLLVVAASVLPPEFRTTYVMMAIIGCFTWTGMARFTRAEFLKLRNQDFVQAAQAVGLPLRSILFRHMLPNGVAPVLVDASFAIAAAITVEAVLSYLGLGPIDQASWGKLLASAINAEGEFKWWLAVFPGVAIFLTVLSYNLIGEALRDAIDPKLKKARV